MTLAFESYPQNFALSSYFWNDQTCPCMQGKFNNSVFWQHELTARVYWNAAGARLMTFSLINWPAWVYVRLKVISHDCPGAAMNASICLTQFICIDAKTRLTRLTQIRINFGKVRQLFIAVLERACDITLAAHAKATTLNLFVRFSYFSNSKINNVGL